MAPSTAPRRCLVIHPGALGDVLLAVPALAHLGGLGFLTTLAVAGRLVPLFAASGLVARALELETLGLHRLFQASPGPGALEPLARYDAVVSWLGAGEVEYRTNLAALGCPVVVARATPPPDSGMHVSRHLLMTLAPLGPVSAQLPEARFHVSDAARAAAATWLAARGVGPGEVAVLQPGAGSAGKVWPGFPVLARRLRRSTPVVALAGPADSDVAGELLATRSLEEAEIVRDWPLPRIAALLAVAGVAVGNDSGPTHLAAVVGCPTVALFGPTDPGTWAPVGPRVHVVAAVRGQARWAGVEIERVETAIEMLVTGVRGAAVTPPVGA